MPIDNLLGFAQWSDVVTLASLAGLLAFARLWRKDKRRVLLLEKEREEQTAERQRTQQALGRFELVVRHSRDIILFMRRDGRVLETNPAATLAYGYSHEELLGLTIQNLRSPETHSLTPIQLGEADKDGALFETVHRRKDGSTFPVEVSSRGATVGGERLLVSVVRDISERRHAEARESEERQKAEQRAAELDAILNSLVQPLVVTNAHGELLRTNPAYDRIFATPEEWRELGIAERSRRLGLQTPEGEPVDPALLPGTRALAGEPVSGVVIRLPRPDGSFVYLSISASPIRMADAILGMVGVFTDITERIRAEQALLEADRHKNEFIAVLSHELRNPMAPIKSSLYILDHTTPESAQARRAQQVIDRQVTQMARLIDDLLDMTRISRGKVRLQRESMDLSEIVRATGEDHRELFRQKGISLELSVPEHPLRIHGDRTRIAQIIGNLLHNSAKFTPGHGSTQLSLFPERENRVAIEVRDTGSGLEPRVLRTLFDPFVQANQSAERGASGLGLGLALVRGLVELHGGTVSASSEGPGKGTCITVRLPLEAPAAPALCQLPSPPLASAALRVLLIDDNEDGALSLQEILELGGHLVDVAFTGAEGIEKASAAKPDMILCDLGLPIIDGYGVARALRANPECSNTFLVALSGYAQPEDIERSREAGFDRHVAKPLDIELLLRMVAELSASRAWAGQTPPASFSDSRPEPDRAHADSGE